MSIPPRPGRPRPSSDPDGETTRPNRPDPNFAVPPGYSTGYPPPGQPGYPPNYPPQQPPRPYPPPAAAPRRPIRRRPAHRRPAPPLGCLVVLFMLACLLLTSVTYAILPGRTNILLLGIDYAEPGSYTARADTIMLSSFTIQKPHVRLLSIPRDLWVQIPGVGENRINTAHFYAESTQPGSGPQAVIQTVEENFGVEMDYYLRIKFEGFREIVDALGGVDIHLSEPTAGYEAGRHHLTGRKALAFVRDRADADDFFRMSHGQLMLKSLFTTVLNPLNWPRLPAVGRAFFSAVDSNIPLWMWPRLGLILLYTGPNNISETIISREMVTPFTTDQGANVLLPNWDLIHLLIQEIFSK